MLLLQEMHTSLAKGARAAMSDPQALEEWGRQGGFMHLSVYLSVVLGVLSVTRVCGAR